MILNMTGKGGGGTILVSDTQDAAGGTIRTITAKKVVSLQTKTITPTSSQQTVNPDTGYDGFSQVVVEAGGGGGIENTYEVRISKNNDVWLPAETYSTLQAIQQDVPLVFTTGYGAYIPVSYDRLDSDGFHYTVVEPDVLTQDGVDVYITCVDRYVYDSSNTATIEYSFAYYDTSSADAVAANVLSGKVFYTSSGRAVGTMSTMTLPTSAAASATSGYTSKATISRSTSDQYINIPPGYNSAGGYYKISAVANGSATAPSTISGTSATVTTGTNTLTLTKTVSVTPTVSAGYVSSGTAGNSSVSLTASVTVNPTPTASGATVTIPAGYYSSQTTKSVTSGSASAPSTISGTSATVTTGTNTLTLTKTVSVTPSVSAGYVSSGTATNSSVSLTASVTTKAAATITPGTTNQTIASGTYLTGTQTIAGDADLVASNIVSGVQIFGVTGNVVLQNYYTGSSAPSSSLGSNGDLYLQN